MFSFLSNATLKVTFEPENGSDPFNITLDFNDSLLEIKEKIKRSQNIPISMQTLIYNGNVLQDDFNVLDSGLHHYVDSRIQLVIAPESDEAAGIVENSSMNIPLEMDVIDTECLDEKIQEMEAVLKEDSYSDKNLMHVPLDEAPAGLVKNTMHVPLEKYGNDTDEGLKETIQEIEVYNIQELEAGIEKFLPEMAAIPELQDYGSSFGDFSDLLWDSFLTPTPPASEAELSPPSGPVVSPPLPDLSNPLWAPTFGPSDTGIAPPPGPPNAVSTPHFDLSTTASAPLFGGFGSSFGDFSDLLWDSFLTPTPPASEAELSPPSGPVVSPPLPDLSNPLWAPTFGPSDTGIAPPPGPPNAVSTPHFDLSTTASAPLFGGFGPSSFKPALLAPWSGPSNTVSAPLCGPSNATVTPQAGPSNARMGPPSRLTKEILPPPTGSSRRLPNKLKVTVLITTGNRFKVEVEVQDTDKVEVLRKKIERLQGELHFSLPEDRAYVFVHRQVKMDEDMPFLYHGVCEGDTIWVRDSASNTPMRRF